MRSGIYTKLPGIKNKNKQTNKTEKYYPYTIHNTEKNQSP